MLSAGVLCAATALGWVSLSSGQADAATVVDTTIFTTSTRHVTTTERTDLPDAPAAACGTPAVAPTLVGETSTEQQSETVTTYFAPATVFVGEDQSEELDLVAGGSVIDDLTTYTTTVAQTFQGTAAGDPCPVAVAPVGTPVTEPASSPVVAPAAVVTSPVLTG